MGEDCGRQGKIAEYLKFDKSATSRRVKAALDAGYLVNKEAEGDKGKKRRVRKYDLDLGDPMPAEQAILPVVEALSDDGDETPAPVVEECVNITSG